jgi:CHASE3 domain sensor protein
MRAANPTFKSLSAAERRILTAVVVASVVVVFVAAIAFLLAAQTLRETRRSESSVERTRDVLEQVQQLLSTLQDAETGERGFVITGSEGFLEPYDRARLTLEPRLAKLLVSVGDREASAIAEQLAERARTQMKFLEGVVELRRAGDVEAARKLIAQELGKLQMDAIRKSIADLESRELALCGASLWG